MMRDHTLLCGDSGRFRELTICVHPSPHADPVGIEEVTGGDNDFAAEGVEIVGF
jgi:hypothetical protein